MVLANSYYYTTKLEIKPQPSPANVLDGENYYTTKLEIKPQLFLFTGFSGRIIIQQN